MTTDTHSIEIDADADAVYARLEDVSLWSEMFDPTIHGTELSREEDLQTIQLWATANGQPKTWVSERRLDPATRRISWHQSITAAPVATMSGTWSVSPTGPGRSSVELHHTYTADDGTAESLAWIAQAVDTNSVKELAALKVACEREQDAQAASFTFSDEVVTDADPHLVFAFLDRGDRWAERLEHVADVRMDEFPGELQFLRLTTQTSDGDFHVTESFRLSQAPATLRYKQTTLPKLLSLHTGLWTITPAGEQWRVRSQHTVAIRTEAVTELLGPKATVEDARRLARSNLGNNSTRTLEAAVRWAQSVSSPSISGPLPTPAAGP